MFSNAKAFNKNLSAWDMRKVTTMSSMFNGNANGASGYTMFNNGQSSSIIGTNPLTSKRYFPGAHAYRLNPRGAKQLVERARLEASPTDIFLNLDTFPFLQEYYPWPVEVRESFSTIQKTEGCLAKHMYSKDYIIEDV